MWNHYRNKYSANKVVVDGIEFASRKEARHYQDLVLLLKAGEISELQTQVRYVLIPAQREPDIIGPRGGRKAGKVIEKELCYIADFTFRDKEGNLVVQDVKGYKGGQAYALFSVKRKLMLWIHGIKVEEI